MVRALVAAIVVLAAFAPAAGAAERYRVLVFTETAGFRHDSIAAGVEAIRSMGRRNGFAVTHTEDSAVFRRRLGRYAAVVWLSVTGDVLDGAEQAGLRRYVLRGGGFAGIHAASNAEDGWPWYRRLIGARFRTHPAVQPATIRVVDRRHPSTRRLPRRWARTDEWYDFQTRPGRRVRVLATLDEATYTGAGMGAPHPIAWCRKLGRGRSWYTGLGHTTESYAEPLFRSHLLGGIRWAARRR